MTKKNLTNSVIAFACLVLPNYFFYLHKDAPDAKTIQGISLAITLAGSCLLIVLNHRARKQAIRGKATLLGFEILGAAGFLYSAGLLVLIFLYRNCCGF